MAEPWLSADDIAAHLGITKDTVYTWIAEKAMPAHKVGRLWKFQASEIDDWVRGRARTLPLRTPAQLRQLQFHWGKPPPAAAPRMMSFMVSDVLPPPAGGMAGGRALALSGRRCTW